MLNKTNQELVIVRGAGEMASGVIHRLVKAGYKIIALEQSPPICIRRYVCFASAFYEQHSTVEDLTAELVDTVENSLKIIDNNNVALLIDPMAKCLDILKPIAIIDARMLKKESDISIDMARIVIGLGPGFIAGKNCHAVVETNRGHNLGRVYYDGSAEAYNSQPGNINGYTNDRVLRAPDSGILKPNFKITDKIKTGEIVGEINGEIIKAKIDGIIRGLIHPGVAVYKNQKIGDIDPRGIKEYCYKISDKANAIAGGALEALLYFSNKSLQFYQDKYLL